VNAFFASVRSLAEAAIVFRADANWIDLKEPGTGVMLDTAKKTGVGLRGLMSTPELAIFVETARQHDVFCGPVGQFRTK